MDYKHNHNSGSANVKNPAKSEADVIAESFVSIDDPKKHSLDLLREALKNGEYKESTEILERLTKIEESIASQARSFSELQIVLSSILGVVNRQGKPEYR